MKTFASLFTGEGLMDVGAQMAGLQTIWGVEVESKHADIAQQNLGHKVYVESVIDSDWRKYDRPNHLHASPPCIRASQANPKNGETALDIELAGAVITAIQYFQPNSFTLENVICYRHFKSFQQIVDCLWGAGYWVNSDILNSADFGVPQTRKRLFLRAVKGFAKPLPTPTEWLSWHDAIADILPNMPQAKLADWQRRVLPDVTRNSGLHLIECQNTSRDATVRYQTEPSCTIVSSWDRRHPKILDFATEIGWRLNAKAIARLQTVPDWFEGATIRGIGNGVPCLMAKAIVESVDLGGAA